MSDDNSRSGSGPYRDFFEHFADALLIIEGGRFVDCNLATIKMLRCSTRQEVLQTRPSDLSPPTQPDGRDSREKADEMITIAFERGSHRFQWNHQRADGEVFPVEVMLTAIELEGRPILQVNWRDITERKRLEAELRHAQKMEAVGVLAGGIAHDFNNLLVAILGHSDLLEMMIDDRQDLLEHVSEIQNAGDRAATLVRQLLAFSRKQEVQLDAVDLNVLVRDLADMLGRLIGEHVTLTVKAGDEALPVRVDISQTEQVVVNLVTNARDAIEGDGTIDLELSVIDDGRTRGTQDRRGEYARLRVRDSGRGMDPETLERAFEPFFTTKEPGQGTGLGLSTVYGIVQGLGGTVSIRSEAGRGSVVDVVLPLTEAQAVEPTREAMAADDGGHETVLVVEDESAVMKVVAGLLDRRGYRVLTATDGVEALSVFDRVGNGEIDLVVSDVVMPRMGGVELVENLKAGNRCPRVIFMSAYSRHAVSSLKRLAGGDSFIEKPFATKDLANLVRHVLDASNDDPVG